MHPVLFHVGTFLIPTHGALAALGVVLALALLHRTARQARLAPAELWNLSILALCAALVGARLVYLALALALLRLHPAALLRLALLHRLVFAAVAALVALAVAALWTRLRGLAPARTADALAAPLALGLSVEQLGAFFAGAGYGTRTSVRWAVSYTDPLALRWNSAPLFTPVHPVQLYAASGWFLLALALLLLAPRAPRPGDLAGIFLFAAGVLVYLTEFFRNAEGRGAFLSGALHLPQLGAVASVFAGALVLRQRPQPSLPGNPHA